jgi:hypothetical protein
MYSVYVGLDRTDRLGIRPKQKNRSVIVEGKVLLRDARTKNEKIWEKSKSIWLLDLHGQKWQPRPSNGWLFDVSIFQTSESYAVDIFMRDFAKLKFPNPFYSVLPTIILSKNLPNTKIRWWKRSIIKRIMVWGHSTTQHPSSLSTSRQTHVWKVQKISLNAACLNLIDLI